MAFAEFDVQGEGGAAKGSEEEVAACEADDCFDLEPEGKGEAGGGGVDQFVEYAERHMSIPGAYFA